MRQKITFIFISFILTLVFPAKLLAADLTYDADSYIELTSPAMTLTVLNGSTADSVTVNAGNIQVTMSAGQTFTLKSNNGCDLSSNSLNLPNTCNSDNSSQIVLTVSSTQTITITPSLTVICTTSTTGGTSSGGGGGSSSDTTPPTAPSNIQVSDLKTGNSLRIIWTKPLANDFSYVKIYRSIVSGDLGTLIPDAQTGISFVDTGLTKNQTYYYTLRSVDSSGNESANSIQISGRPTELESSSQEITGTTETTISLSDKSASVNIPAGAITGTATVNMSQSTNFTLPLGNYGVAGNQVYNLQVISGNNNITNFSQPLTLTFAYTDSQITGLIESSLKINYWDETNKKWVVLSSTLNMETNTLIATVNHLTVFAIIGEKSAEATTGSLAKLKCSAKAPVNDPCRSVYYLANNGKRYVFPNQNTYYSWYADFSQVIEISASTLADYPIAGNVTIRPGTYLVKITTDPKVYAVEPGGKLRWVESETVAKKLWGNSWAKKVVDVPDAFFVNYQASNAVANKLTNSYPEGSLIKYSNSSAVYYIENNQKRMFKTGTAFSQNGLRDEFIATAPVDITYESGKEIINLENKINNAAGL